MGLVIHIIASPMIAYFMALIWVAMFGDSVTYMIDNSMIEEWLLCMQLYILIILLKQFKKKVSK